MDDQVVAVSGSYLPNPLFVVASGWRQYDYRLLDSENSTKEFVVRDGRDAVCYTVTSYGYGRLYEGELTISQVMALAVLQGNEQDAMAAARALADKILEDECIG